MNCSEFRKILKLENKIIAITRKSNVEGSKKLDGCSLKELRRVLNGETIVFTDENMGCIGANTGFGFVDGLPDMPGGFGNFLCAGKGEGYPVGERIKCSSDIAERMLLNQPQKVMDNYNAIVAEQYNDDKECELVTILANSDQLAALVHLFNYRKIDYDNVIMPMTSGCASLFRIPFGEIKKENPRAVIGNVDIFSRPHFDKDTYFFIIPNKDFKNMLIDADESFLFAPIWNGIKSRL